MGIVSISGNVIFSSAIHGYAFGIEDFAEIYYEKVKIPKQELIKGLFGDFYMQPGEIKVRYFMLFLNFVKLFI